MPTTKTLLCLGVSARWLVQSLAQIGFADTGVKVIAADLFADADTTEFAPVHRVSSLEELPALVDELRPTYAVMGSGFETHLAMVESIAAKTLLLNASLESVHRVRDPWILQEFAAQNAIRFPKTYSLSEKPPQGGEFVLKDLHRAGGTHVRRSGFAAATESSYFQSWVDGIPMSASFLAGSASFQNLGVFRQLLGETAFGCQSPFQFAGAIGPLRVSSELQTEVLHCGSAIARDFGLRGLFGIDFVLDHLGHVWLIEVNPRPTSAMELIERVSICSLVSEHSRAFGLQTNASSELERRRSSLAAKAILFWNQSQALEIDEPMHDALMVAWQKKEIGDVPGIGTQIQPGHPIVTMFGEGVNEAAAYLSLQTGASNWYRFLNAN